MKSHELRQRKMVHVGAKPLGLDKGKRSERGIKCVFCRNGEASMALEERDRKRGADGHDDRENRRLRI